MSNAVKKMSKDIAKAAEVQQKTKTVQFRIDVLLDGVAKTAYMVVTGVPEDLPKEYDNTIMMAAERQFASALNEKTFLEFYNPGKTAKDEQPIFYNISKIGQLQVNQITEVQ